MFRIPTFLRKQKIVKLLVSRTGDYFKVYDKPSGIKIDVLIPTIDKDLATLPRVIKSIRENILDEVQNIYIVSRRGMAEEFCKRHNLIFVDEDNVLPIKKSDINYSPKGMDRSGWIFQQLLKLNADHICECDNILVADSDTVFSRKQSFFSNGRTVFDTAEEFHKPYFRTMRKVTGMRRKFLLSFVAHHMMFDAKFLKELKDMISKHTGQEWYLAILNNLSQTKISSFSEYETYGNFMYFFHRDKVSLKFWHNAVVLRDKFDDLSPEFKNRYKTISMHSYNEK